MSEIIGYLDRWSVRAGEPMVLHVHASESTPVVADLVQLTSASRDVLRAPVVASKVLSRFDAGPQRTEIGSFARLPLPPYVPATDCTLVVLVHPTSSQAGVVATVLDARGATLTLRWSGRGQVQLCDRDQQIRAEIVAPVAKWTAVAVVLPASAIGVSAAQHDRSLIRLYGWPVGSTIGSSSGASSFVVAECSATIDAPTSIWLAARPDVDGASIEHFDGMIEAPAVYAASLEPRELQALTATPGGHVTGRAVIAAWDFAREPSTDRLVDCGPSGAHGVVRQGPTRYIPGAFWKAGILDPARDPARFAAIHFHCDDLRDAGWRPSTTITVPPTLPSGVYGVRVRAIDSDVADVIPCWVRAASPAQAHPLAFLAPTYTYMAYGNAPNAMLGPAYWGGDSHFELLRKAHHEFGPSLYSRHPDHSGVSLVSRHRPILTIRPDVRPWGFEADRLLTGWMAREGYAFDVLSDEDIDVEGAAALAPHRVIVTGNHPEYWSARMLDALEEWLRGGGRLVYTGGNGFYWRISSVASLPGVIECRRAEGGTRPWISEPGRYHHQLDEAPGGLWRRLGRAPQQLVGVGFTAQGFERASPYRVRPASREGWSAFALAGVEHDLIGTSGLFGGGAAGQEIDRHDHRLGSPSAAVVLASSQGLHDDTTLRTVEELLSHEPPAMDPKVRADMTLTPTDGGGMVFASGSMAFVGALDDAGISRVLHNVLDRFLDAAPIDITNGAT